MFFLFTIVLYEQNSKLVIRSELFPWQPQCPPIILVFVATAMNDIMDVIIHSTMHNYTDISSTTKQISFTNSSVLNKIYHFYTYLKKFVGKMQIREGEIHEIVCLTNYDIDVETSFYAGKIDCGQQHIFYCVFVLI